MSNNYYGKVGDKRTKECRRCFNTSYVLDEIISDLEKSKATWVGTPRTIEVDETDEARIFETRMFYSCSSCSAEFGQYKPSDAYCKFCGAKMEETDIE